MERASKNMSAADRLCWICPECLNAMTTVDADTKRCGACSQEYTCVEGVWCFLTPERAGYFKRFIEDYETIRRAEGRGSRDPAFYRALPYEDLSGKHSESWKIRSVSYRTFLGKIVDERLAGKDPKDVRVLDLGAGNCWLASRLAARGLEVAAVDLSTDINDGLGAYRHYDQIFVPVQADFNRLPFDDDQFRFAVFNASFHYAVDPECALREAKRVLRKDGEVVILDSPLYHSDLSGREMVREQKESFEKLYGLPSDTLPSQGFLTYRRLEELERTAGFQWSMVRPYYGLRWALRPWKARLLGRREPARFALIIGHQAEVT